MTGSTRAARRAGIQLGQQGNARKHQRGNHVDNWIGRCNAEQQTVDEPRQPERGANADPAADGGKPEPGSYDAARHLAAIRPQRLTQADLRHPLTHVQREHPVHTDRLFFARGIFTTFVNINAKGWLQTDRGDAVDRQVITCVSCAMADVFDAISTRARRAILDELVERDGQTLFELCARLTMRHGLGLTRQAISQHLEVLESAGLVTSERQGRCKLHYLDTDPLEIIFERWVRPRRKGAES